MGAGGITQTVNGFKYRIQCGEVTYSVISSGYIIIDGARDTNTRVAHFSELFSPHVGAITTNHHQSFNTVLF